MRREVVGGTFKLERYPITIFELLALYNNALSQAPRANNGEVQQGSKEKQWRGGLRINVGYHHSLFLDNF